MPYLAAALLFGFIAASSVELAGGAVGVDGHLTPAKEEARPGDDRRTRRDRDDRRARAPVVPAAVTQSTMWPMHPILAEGKLQ